ncbi:MAG TPA: hypothetical protein VF102_11670 [Gemmatimonadaceae bacterium]
MKSVLRVVGAMVVSVGVASVPAQQTAPTAGRPLSPYATRRVLVIPTHYLRTDDSLGWAAQITDRKAFLDDVDGEIAFALRDRDRIGRMWVFPHQLAENARRNAPYAPDVYDLAAEWLRPPMKKVPDMLPEPLASQLRTLVALEDDCRYVLFPIEVRFDGAGPGEERAVVRLVVFDARQSRITWMGDVSSDPATKFSRGLAASFADHLANLVSAP